MKKTRIVSPEIGVELELLNDMQSAHLLGVAPGTLRTWRIQGRGPAYVRLGRAIRYTRAALAEFVAASTVRIA